MLATLRNAWGIPELRKKLIFTMIVLLAYRIGNAIPVPFVDVDTLSAFFDATLSTTILGFYNALSGSASLRHLSWHWAFSPTLMLLLSSSC